MDWFGRLWTDVYKRQEEAIKENFRFIEVIDQLAKDKGVTKAQIALSWILSQNDEITAIPGTRKIHRLEENLGALNVELNQADFDVIEASMPKITIGNRY